MSRESDGRLLLEIDNSRHALQFQQSPNPRVIDHIGLGKNNIRQLRFQQGSRFYEVRSEFLAEVASLALQIAIHAYGREKLHEHIVMGFHKRIVRIGV